MTDDPVRQLVSAAQWFREADREREDARQRLVKAILDAWHHGALTVPQIADLSGYSRQHVHRLLAERPTP